jgi:hypothetical protein
VDKACGYAIYVYLSDGCYGRIISINRERGEHIRDTNTKNWLIEERLYEKTLD